MKSITCIICPIGCRVTVDCENGEYSFSGNQCRRGAEFAQAELTSPVRTLTTTVRTVFPGIPALPVRTSTEVPKSIIPDIIRELSRITITEKTGIGETIAANICGTGSDVIAAGNILMEDENE